jgi:ribosome-binding factor A
MSLRRVQKVAEAIREVVSMSILTELQDPRVRAVTVTGVEASGDLRFAKVMVSVMGDETRQNLTLRGLQSAAGFLQSKIAERIDLRYTPRLTFVLDQGVKHSIAVAQILREVLPPEKPEADDDFAPGEEGTTLDDNGDTFAAEAAGPAELTSPDQPSVAARRGAGDEGEPVDPPLPPAPSPHT